MQQGTCMTRRGPQRLSMRRLFGRLPLPPGRKSQRRRDLQRSGGEQIMVSLGRPGCLEFPSKGLSSQMRLRHAGGCIASCLKPAWCDASFTSYKFPYHVYRSLPAGIALLGDAIER
eukprot:4063175-Heterocapsa_arctica.AAC.1